jgi:hypothetical protein
MPVPTKITPHGVHDRPGGATEHLCSAGRVLRDSELVDNEFLQICAASPTPNAVSSAQPTSLSRMGREGLEPRTPRKKVSVERVMV